MTPGFPADRHTGRKAGAKVPTAATSPEQTPKDLGGDMKEQGLKFATQLHLQARDCLKRHSNLRGARQVLAVMPETADGEGYFSDEDIYAPRFPGYTKGKIVEMNVPMTDPKALRDYIARYQELMRQCAADLELGHAREAEEKQREMELIRRHIREVRDASGRIRNFPSSATKEYQRAFQNFRYLLAALQFEDPEVYHYLKRHVKMGAEPAWVDTGEEDGPMAQD
jgi:hypothetical protein